MFIFCAVLVVTICGLTALFISMSLGHLVAFLMYFSENEDTKISKFLYKYFGIEKRTRLDVGSYHSAEIQFAFEKINKHGGFILEAFMEALPQSILQV